MRRTQLLAYPLPFGPSVCDVLLGEYRWRLHSLMFDMPDYHLAAIRFLPYEPSRQLWLQAPDGTTATLVEDTRFNKFCHKLTLLPACAHDEAELLLRIVEQIGAPDA